MTPNTSASPALPPDEKVSAWSLIKPYWVSEERKTAWGLLIAIIVMNLLVVWINVRLNTLERRLLQRAAKPRTCTTSRIC